MKRDATTIQLIAFLGNPGNQYERTRHNVGWLVADEYAPDDTHNWKEKFQGLFVRAGGRILIKPQTFMNRSGYSIQKCASFFSVDAAEIAVVHDDLESPFGTVKLEFGGGLRGHNGLRSIREQVGTEAFWRLRVGVGRPEGQPHGRRQSVSAYVLERFRPDEEAALPRIVTEAAQLLPR